MLKKLTLLTLFLLASSNSYADLPDVESLIDEDSSWQPVGNNIAQTSVIEENLEKTSIPDKHNVKLKTQDQFYQLTQKLEYLQQEVQDLRGKLEEQEYNYNTLKQNTQELYLDLERKILNPKVAQTTKTNQAIQADITPKPADKSHSPQTQTVKSLTEKEMYDKAYQVIAAKNYDTAISDLKTLLKVYPNGQYAANSLYWLGELYLVKGNLDAAKNAFGKVFHEHGKHQKASDALLKLGYIEYNNEQWETAKQKLVAVKTKYPNTTAAKLADAKLQLMASEGKI